MARFFIEVPHEANLTACNRAIEIFLRTGSHFLTHADWGCKDDDHKAWIIVEVDTKEEARNMVPAEYRPTAKIVRLTSFANVDVDKLSRQHPA